MSGKTPRGMRLNNPANIKRTSPVTPWQGLSTAQDDPVFVSFKDVTWGIRACARILIAYQDKHKLNTIPEFMARFAPPSDNNPTDAYVRFIIGKTGFKEDTILDMHNYNDIKPLIKAIIHFEQGIPAVTDAQIDKGLVLAGIEEDKKSLSDSRTIKGAQVATLGVGLSAASEVISESAQAVSGLVPFMDTMKILFVALTLIGIGITVFARWDDFRRGLR